MKRRVLLPCVAAVVVAVVAGGCGGESPTAPSAAGGVVVQGVVLGDGASVAAADTQTSTARARKVTVRVDGTTLTVDVSANGTFQLKGIPSGTFTLVFLVDGVEIGRVVVTAEDGFAVKIVVQVTESALVVVEIKVEGTAPDSDPAKSSCVVNGGKPGAGIELEGNVTSGSSAQFELAVSGRSSVPVVVNASSASFRCVGSTKTTSETECKAAVKAGAKVHVRGTLMACATAPAQVTAIEVKVQKD